MTGRAAIRVHNAPRAVLAAGVLLGLTAPFLGHAPNRLLSGAPVAAPHGLLVAGMAAVLIGLAVLPPRRLVQVLAFSIACLGILLACFLAGQAADDLARHNPPASRTLLGAGFWSVVFCFGLAAVDAAQRLRAGVVATLGMAAIVPACVAGLAAAGRLDALSLAQEAASHADVFADALLRHLLLVGATLALALALGLPLGLAVQRRAAWRGPVFGVLGVIQTLPSVALFGLLIAPLAAAGLSGIGIVPALVALVLYALLPVVRAVVTGLDGVDTGVRDAATGMGLSPRQRLAGVEIPLAAPALLAGLRIVTVQTIGLAVIAALIGAGGLGDFVFQGLGQYAVDLVLLGALPAIALALAADLLLRLAAARFQVHRA